MSNKVRVTVADMRAICAPCADKMVRDGVKHFYLDATQPGLGVPAETKVGVANSLRKFAVGQTYEIKGVQIFSAGVWNDDAYSVQDIDAMVSAFTATRDALKPYLKLGHNEDQTMLAEDELPAAGWITNVYRQGSKLLADFADMPRKIYELVQAKAYKRVSSEILVNADIGGVRYPYALKAVALLGGETPAVQNLDDVHALYALDLDVLAYIKQAEVRAYQFDPAQPPKEANSMPDEPAVKENALPPALPSSAPGAPKPPAPAAPAQPPALVPHAAPAPAAPAQPDIADNDECYKQLKAACMELDTYKKSAAAAAPAQAQMASDVAQYKLQASELRAELSQTREDLSKARGELQKIYAEKTRGEIKVQVDRFVQDKKILPVQSAALEALLFHAKETGVKKFKVGDKDFNSAEEILREFIASGSSGLSTEARTETGKDIAVPAENDGAAMDQAVRAYMAKNSVKSYREAYVEVAKTFTKVEKA